ncbi:hypothetical protein RND71_003609 [Anisodus tanguticus]|uniref:Uncharacterized protein n=1 Tax=Anisodus tanguticus TaxID=243964 RepID=A0AAE1SX38_9SOLA|nr:hypothetical protein RND71_003609 [Anisodus tanguticus]
MKPVTRSNQLCGCFLLLVMFKIDTKYRQAITIIVIRYKTYIDESGDGSNQTLWVFFASCDVQDRYEIDTKYRQAIITSVQDA